MNWARALLAIVVISLFPFSTEAISDPFAANPYPSHEAPEAPSRTPVTEPGVNPANPLPPFTAPLEDLFHRNYWYLVLLDTREVFTSPRHWDSSDWLTLGA